MLIRKAAPEDLPRVLEIYAIARKTMRERGNPDQWGDAYPPQDLIRSDVREGRLRVLCDGDRIAAAAAFCPGEDPFYRVIEGAWKNDKPYLAIHRVASDGSLHGVFRAFFGEAKTLSSEIRVDTHEKNFVMRRAILREGFSYCGVIHVGDGSPRVAFQYSVQRSEENMIHLEKIDAKNVWDVIDLKVAKEQKNFVATNTCSILQAYTAAGTGCAAFPFAICNEKRPVGFVMIGFNEAALYDLYGDIKAPEVLRNNYSIWRLMIDKRWQKRGYGREAIRLALDFIRTWPCGKAETCSLSYEPENTVAASLYHSMGFTENGEMDGDEIVAVLKL